jgi:hypothetical protein
MFNERGNPMHRRRKKFFMIPFFILLFFGFGAAVQALWNAILPEVTHASPINYWQAMGLLVLCKILFGNFHFGHRGGRPGFAGPDMREKWKSMTDEERAVFKQRFKDRCRRM